MINTIPEFLDIEFLQILQDRLAEEFEIGSIITDVNGLPLTKPSNFSEFCIKHTRGTEIGLKKCMLCDAYGGVKAKTLKKPIVYRCHAGLIDFASPIIMENTLVGCFLCGQILSEKPDENKFRQIAREIGIDEDTYIEALRNVKIFPYEKIESIANFLYDVSSKISNFTYHQNVGISSGKFCKKSINDFDNFLKSVNNDINCISKKNESFGQRFWNRFYDTLFKNYSTNQKNLECFNKNIDNFATEINTITEKIKFVGENFMNNHESQ